MYHCFYAKSYTSRPPIPKIAAKLSKMAPPDKIKYRGSLTTPIVAKGLKVLAVYRFCGFSLSVVNSTVLLPPVCNLGTTDAYLESSRTSLINAFCENSQLLNAYRK